LGNLTAFYIYTILSEINLSKEKKSEKNPDVSINPKKELNETQQEVMLELKLKTDEFLKKFKANNDRNRVKMDNI
jgi:hypothetical protein